MEPSLKQDLWKKTTLGLFALDETRLKDEQVFTKINKLHDKLSLREPKLPEEVNLANGQKMLDLYNNGADKSKIELGILSGILENVDAIIALEEASGVNTAVASEKQVDRKRKSTEDIRKPEFSGGKEKKMIKVSDDSAKASGALQQGARVAVKPQGFDWILALVVKYIPEKSKYEVEDAEDDEQNPGHRKRYVFPAKSVLPIDGQIKRSEFGAGSVVLALYPNSSCFYQAFVITPPSKITEPAYFGHYAVKFEDDDFNTQYVPTIMVLEMPKSLPKKS